MDNYPVSWWSEYEVGIPLLVSLNVESAGSSISVSPDRDLYLNDLAHRKLRQVIMSFDNEVNSHLVRERLKSNLIKEISQLILTGDIVLEERDGYEWVMRK
jgi:hypothetical protein